MNFGNTFEHVPSMEDQHDGAWVHCLTLERNEKSFQTWMLWKNVENLKHVCICLHLYHALQQLEYSQQTCFVLVYIFKLHQTDKAVINAASFNRDSWANITCQRKSL